MAIEYPVIPCQPGLQGSLFLRMQYPWGSRENIVDKFADKKELSYFTKNSLRLQGKNVSRKARKEEIFFDRIDRINKIYTEK